MEKKLFNLSKARDIFEVGKITIFMSVFLSCLILLTVFGTPATAAVKYPPGALLQPGDITTTHIRNGTIIDEDLNSSAALSWSKIDKTGSSLADLATHAATDLTGTLGVTHGGTGLDALTSGDLITATATNTFGALAKGTANQVLGMNSGATTQEYKTITAGTGIAVTHGANSITIGVSNQNTLTQSFTAGETIAAGKAVYVSDGTLTRTIDSWTQAGDAYGSFGRPDNNNQRTAESFVPGGNATITSIKIYLKKQGSPTDNVKIGIQATSGGLPDGTWIDSGTVAGATLTTDYAEYTFNMSAAVTGGQTYWIVLDRSGSYDVDNYYWPKLENPGTDTGGAYKEYHNSTWNNSGMELTAWSIIATETAGQVYMSEADTSGRYQGFVGFTTESIAWGASGNVAISGTATGLSSLTIGKQYYISDTFGAIGTTAGSASRKACISLSATTCLITNIW